MIKKLLFCVTATLACSQAFADNWLFRGTPNAWGLNSPMTAPVAPSTLFTTCQNFTVGDAGGGTRFKISNATKATATNSWVEAFPATDFQVAANTSFDITFNPVTRAIVATPRTTACGTVASSSVASSVVSSSKSSVVSSVASSVNSSAAGTVWLFRGTPNNWDLNRPLVKSTGNLFITCQNFTVGDAGGGTRFKISNATKATPTNSWVEAFPAADFNVATNTSFDITFDSVSHAITATARTSACGTTSSSSIPSSSSSKPSSSSTPSSSSSTPSSSAAGTVWLFRGTPNNWDLTRPLTKSTGNLFVTCQNFTVGDAGGGTRFKISNATKATPTNSWVEAFPAGDFAVAANTSFDITFDSVSHAITATARTSLCGSLNINADRSLLIHDQATLNFADANGSVFNLKRILAQLAVQLNVQNPTRPTSAAELFARMWDSQNDPAQAAFTDGPKCTGTLNGFANECRTFGEGRQAFAAETEMAKYIPIALVNRFDLHDAAFNNCGEHRVIFGRNDFSRNFIIFEAQVANPIPGNPNTCLPIVNFWKNLTDVNSAATRGQLLADFYFKGFAATATSPAVTPVFLAANYAPATGQIRANEFMGGDWLLKEFKVVIENGLSHIKPATVKSNPFGPLFNDIARTDSLAVQFRTQFLNNMPSLLVQDLSAFSLTVQNDEHNNGQSHASGNTSENEYLNNTNQGSGAFRTAIQNRATALNSPLTVDQILNRASAMSCGGCHQTAVFTDVGFGKTWPTTLGFVHVSEFPNNGIFPISDALQNVFIPARKAGMEAFINSFNAAPAALSAPAVSAPVLTGKRSG